MTIRCATCDYQLAHVNDPCPVCLPNFYRSQPLHRQVVLPHDWRGTMPEYLEAINRGEVRDITTRTTTSFEKELEGLINRFSQENPSNTPDFILAQYLMGCLTAWNRGVQQRETWYGRDARPTLGGREVTGSPESPKL